MNNEIRMSVSSMTRNDDKKGVYVLFTDGDKSAEFVLPGAKILSKKGFTDDELKDLTAYVNNQADEIYEIAKKVDPMKAFMGREQGV